MKLSYTFLALQLASTPHAFTFQRYTTTPSTSLFASTDPLVAAYQKKAPAAVDFSLPSSSSSSPPPEAIVTPPPPPVEAIPAIPEPPITSSSSPEPIQSITDAITQAADSALDAAQSATNAAESLLTNDATSTAAATAGTSSAAAIYNKALFGKASATKASMAATAASKTSSEKAPSLLDFVKERKYESSGTDFTQAKENLEKLKANLLGDSEVWKSASEQVSKGVGGVTTATKSVAAKTAAVGAAAQTVGGGSASVTDWNLENLKTSLDGVSLEGLDAHALTNLANNLQFDQYGPWYVSAGLVLLTLNAKEQAIAQAKGKFEVELKEAQDKAQEAAEAAMVAADGAKLAKELVANIPKDGNPSSSGKNVGEELLEQGRVRQLELEKEFMREELSRLKSEVQSLRNALAQVQQVALDDDSESVEIEIPIVKETMEPDPEEEAKILSVLKEIDEANLAAKKKTVTKRKAATKTKTAKKKTVAAKAKTVTAKAKTASKKKAVKKKAASKKKKAVVAEKDDDLLVVEEIAAAMKKEAAKKEEEEKKAPVEKDIPVAAAALDNPWGALKESTLKRKTIAQLTAYLGEREIDVAGFTKAEMVGTVLSL